MEYDSGAEQGILKAACAKPENLQTMLEKGVVPFSFGVMPYRALWEALVRLHLADRPIDEMRLESELGSLWPRLKPLWDKGQKLSDPQWEDFLPSLHSHKVNRSVRESFKQYNKWWDRDPAAVMQFLPIIINELTGIGESAQLLSPKPSVIYAENTLDAEGTPTGLVSLDRMLSGGFRPGELYLCSAPTKHGKTSMAATLTANQIAQGNNVVVFSLEMSQFYFLCRVYCVLATIEWKDAVRKKPPLDREAEWHWAQKETEKHLRIYDPSIQTPDEMSERIKWHMMEFDKISLVIVDHIGLVDRRRRNQMANMAYYLEGQAYDLKEMAVARNVPCWMFSQLSETDAAELINTGNLKQMKARGSGGIKHAADFAFLLARKRDSADEGILRKVLDRITGVSDMAVIKHDPRYYCFYEN